MRCEPTAPRTVTRIDWDKLRDEFQTGQDADNDKRSKESRNSDFKDLFDAEVKRLNSQPERRS